EARDAWAGRVDLQAVALSPIELFLDETVRARLTQTLSEYGGVVGGFTYMIPGLETALDRLFAMASENGFDIDLHVDETADPNARSLKAIAEAALRTSYEGQVTVGHCCSLARQEESEADRTLDLVAEAGLAV